MIYAQCTAMESKANRMTIPDKFRELRERSGFSLAELASRLGYKGASSIQRYESPEYKKDYLHPQLVARMATALVGRGNPRITRAEVLALGTVEAEDLVRSYDVGSHIRHTKFPLDTFDPDEFPRESEEGATIGSETGVRGIPTDASAQLDLTGGLGSGGLSIVSEGVPGKSGMTFAADQIRDYWRLPPAILVTLGLKAHDVAIIPVQGDSMLPTLNEGDVVFIDTRHRQPSPAGLYAILDEIGGVVIKRLEISSSPSDEQQTVSIISDNPRHKVKDWRAEDVHILGRVLRKFGTIQ